MLVCMKSGNTVLMKTLVPSVLLLSASCTDFVGSDQQQSVFMLECLFLRKKMLIHFTAVMFTSTCSPYVFLPVTLYLLL